MSPSSHGFAAHMRIRRGEQRAELDRDVPCVHRVDAARGSAE